MTKTREIVYKKLGYKIVDRASKCAIDMKNIVNAIEAFQSCYGRLPEVSIANNGEADNSELIVVLAGVTNNPDLNRQNPKALQFLALSAKELKRMRYEDPWSHAYHIMLSKLDPGKLLIGTEVVNKTVAIWSEGPNGLNEYGKGDDVCNWR